jgi:predicted transcriptional regulator
MNAEDQDTLIQLTTDVVAAYVSSNTVSPGDLTGLINDVHATLRRLQTGSAEPATLPREPAVSARKSITPDYLVCLEDGKHFKSLKRHLRTDHNLSPTEYRMKWGLKPDYPMVAPKYAQARSDLARLMGLGKRGGSSQAKAAAEPPPAPAAPAAPAGRRKPGPRSRAKTASE